MKAWSTGNCDSGGDEWEQEKRLTEQAVQAINKLEPRPRFFVLCGDLIHAMPGSQENPGPCGPLARLLALSAFELLELLHPSQLTGVTVDQSVSSGPETPPQLKAQVLTVAGKIQMFLFSMKRNDRALITRMS
ncbi:serine/threonine-protein phosphatase CPPED1-like [Otolemur garnettii]|uniref:serine/threonine-protein phosphatase CPPED1-like n=1 Tax=Otolemur garnettii TaxID=30611 RepID=UPI000C7F1F57|nr:serine/threonine-protein phosphatase CPPED1-like [Otolemur garnettii]